MLAGMSSDAIPALDRAIIADATEVGAFGVGVGDLLVLDDESGALTRWALNARNGNEAPSPQDVEGMRSDVQATRRVLVRCRSYTHATATAASIVDELGEEARNRVVIAGIDSPELDLESFLRRHEFSGALAIGRMPKALGAVDDWARATARHSAVQGTSPVLLLGGNTKHMTRSENEALGRSFSDVTGLRGRGKFRCVRASDLREGVGPHTGEKRNGLTGLGGVFSGGKADRGGEALAEAAAMWVRECGADGLRILDLGSGNGSVAHALMSDSGIGNRVAAVVATDVDADAVRSTRSTLAPWAEHTTVTWDDAASQVEDQSADLVLLNPPFHAGTRIDATLVEPLLDAAHRILTPGGTMLFVHNSHLRYRAELEKRFAAVAQVSRDRTFTVLRAVKS